MIYATNWKRNDTFLRLFDRNFEHTDNWLVIQKQNTTFKAISAKLNGREKKDWKRIVKLYITKSEIKLQESFKCLLPAK